jgi:3-hydroxy-3-methylglutaryl CoA synthase
VKGFNRAIFLLKGIYDLKNGKNVKKDPDFLDIITELLKNLRNHNQNKKSDNDLLGYHFPFCGTAYKRSTALGGKGITEALGNVKSRICIKLLDDLCKNIWLK